VKIWEHRYLGTQCAKSPKKQSPEEVSFNTLLQTAFSAILPTGQPTFCVYFKHLKEGIGF